MILIKLQNTQKYGFIDSYSFNNDIFKREYTTEGKFLVLEIYIDNIGKEEISIGQTGVAVVDTKDREYECNILLDKNIEQPGNWYIRPGFNATGHYIFEVPTDFEIDKFIFSKYKELVIRVDFNELEEYKFDF